MERPRRLFFTGDAFRPQNPKRETGAAEDGKSSTTGSGWLGLRNACANWSQEAVHEFVKGLSHPDPVVGAISACSLMHVKEAGEAVMTALSAAVHDGANEIVRFEAARSIAEINFRS